MSREKKQQQEQTAEQMLIDPKYDRLGQDALMKRRMVNAYILLVIVFIALLVFIGLYLDEKRRVQETYRAQYKINLKHVSEDIEAYLDGEADKEMRYWRLTSDMSSVNSFAFLIEDFEDQQKTINEVYSCLIKYPEQMPERLEDLNTAIEDIYSDLDKGYEEADAVVASVDKLGH